MTQWLYSLKIVDVDFECMNKNIVKSHNGNYKETFKRTQGTWGLNECVRTFAYWLLWCKNAVAIRKNGNYQAACKCRFMLRTLRFKCLCRLSCWFVSSSFKQSPVSVMSRIRRIHTILQLHCV